MNREQKITHLMAADADDRRRLALDELDRLARESNSWGTAGHRRGRDEVEKLHDSARRSFESLSEQELDTRLEQGSP